MAVSETPTAPATCPTDEDLAAFLDGMLPEPERARITAHLADCESCYEIFAGAAHFMQDSIPAEQVPARAAPRGRLLPFPFNKDGAGIARSWGIPAAAAAVLILGIGFTGYRLYFAEIMAPELVASLQTGGDLTGHLHRFTAYRGGGDDQGADPLLFQQPSFLVGARLVDLQVCLDKGQREEASELLRGIGQGIQSVPFGDRDESARRYLDAAERLKIGDPGALGEIKAAAPQWEAELQDSPLDESFLTFGKWTEAGRLAAEKRVSSFFSFRNRRFLSFISRQLEGEQKELRKESPSPDDDFDANAEREGAAVAELQQMAALWDRGGLQDKDYDKLAEHFSAILRSYDI